MPIFCLATDLIALVAALETADHLEVGWSVIEEWSVIVRRG